MFLNFNTNNIKYMNSMFYKCSSLTTLDLDVFKFDTKNIIIKEAIFKNCKFNYDKNKFK